MPSTRPPEEHLHAGRTVRLDLTLLAAGTRQHAFVPTSGGLQWVYKIPASGGFAQQYGADLREYQPTGRVKEMLLHALVRLPDDAFTRASRALARWSSAPAFLRRSLDAGHSALIATRGRALERAYRASRGRYFRQMLGLTRVAVDRGLGDLMLAHDILPSVEAVLRHGDAAVTYRGPALVQERADFFDRSGRFDEFNWSDVVSTQQRLWCKGLALSDANEILGPKNWALVGGRLRLADFSSFTSSFRVARRLLRDDVLDARQDRVLRRLWVEAPEQAALAERYFGYVRSEINASQLALLWRCDHERVEGAWRWRRRVSPQRPMPVV
jgi:hypothetical protein